MPKLIITIEEKLVEIPGKPDSKLIGLQTSSNLEIDPEEIGKPSLLMALASLFVQAIKEVQEQQIGSPLYSGEGEMADPEKAAVEIAQAGAFSEFPPEIDA